MGKLQLRAPPHGKPRRNARQDGALGRANRRMAARAVIIPFQIDQRHQPHPRAAFGDAFREDKAVRYPGRQRAVGQVCPHCLLNIRHTACGVLQVYFRQHQPKRAGAIARQRLRLPPVFRLGGVLIAGYASPCGKINPCAG